jgi:hypothetical protein
MSVISKTLAAMGLPVHDPRECPDSAKRFPDGGQYRLEIPSTEGPAALRTVIDEAQKRKVPFHRVSQGSGIMMLPDDEIREMSRIGREAGIEVNLFVGPRATFDTGAQVYTAGGKTVGLGLRGIDQLRYSLMDVERAVDLGIRSILVSDLGCLQAISKMREAGDLPAELILKTSVMMPPANPASARLLEDLGANTINIASDLALPQIASIRSAIDAVIDFYVEAPDNIGGFIRYYEAPDLIRVAAPIYLKMGLRNSPDVYPSGTHLDNTVALMQSERVRRARIVLDLLARNAPDLQMSPLKSSDLGVPAA